MRTRIYAAPAVKGSIYLYHAHYIYIAYTYFHFTANKYIAIQDKTKSDSALLMDMRSDAHMPEITSDKRHTQDNTPGIENEGLAFSIVIAIEN